MTINDFDPRYVQIGRKEAARILGIHERDLDRRRKSDPRCPAGFKKTDSRMALVKFRLSDIHAYRDSLAEDAALASKASK